MQVRVRAQNEYNHTATVIAACKVAGYTFLIHHSISQNGRYSATYAPTGLGITDFDNIPELIATLDNKADRIASAIEQQLATMRESHTPLLAPELGVQDSDWQAREQFRFDAGEYRAVPLVTGREYPKTHYVHLSVTKTESDFVAYTPSEAYGIADRQVRMKFGKYLRKTFPDLTEAEIQSAVVSLRAQLVLEESLATLQFATDRETINRIFETAMYACDSSYVSCMHGKFEHREHRPYHVYADSPDVAVAYVMEHGEITARSVVSTKYKKWIRAYSIRQNDSTLCKILTGMLEQNGYSSGVLIGNRLTKLPSRNGNPVLPYIDHGGMGVTDCGKYWEVCDDSDGEYVADQTDGTATSRTSQCEDCNCNEGECECIYCECCEESFYEGCNTCSMCSECDRCIEHERCPCARCSECNELISPAHRHTTRCACDRCAECGELDSECECVKCDECGRLEEDCACAPNDAEQTVSAEVSA